MARRVLVVDDDLDVQELICEYFRGRGWEAVGVGTVEEGLEGLAAGPEGVIVDQRLPDRDGSALVREAANRGIAVLAMTAFPTIDEALELLAAGASTLLPKPFRLKEMLERLEVAILQRQQEAKQRQRLSALEVLEEAALAETMEEVRDLENRLRKLEDSGAVSPAWRRAVEQAKGRVSRC